MVTPPATSTQAAAPHWWTGNTLYFCGISVCGWCGRSITAPYKCFRDNIKRGEGWMRTESKTKESKRQPQNPLRCQVKWTGLEIDLKIRASKYKVREALRYSCYHFSWPLFSPLWTWKKGDVTFAEEQPVWQPAALTEWWPIKFPSPPHDPLESPALPIKAVSQQYHI